MVLIIIVTRLHTGKACVVYEILDDSKETYGNNDSNNISVSIQKTKQKLNLFCVKWNAC